MVWRQPDGPSDCLSTLLGFRWRKGSSDDTQVIEPGAFPESIHWFRTADNDPFVIDAVVIDKDTYSRSVTMLLMGPPLSLGMVSLAA